MIKHKIVGNAMQMVVCDLSPGEEVYCDAGKFLWKTSNMDTRFGTSKKTQEKKGFLARTIVKSAGQPTAENRTELGGILSGL